MNVGLSGCGPRRYRILLDLVRQTTNDCRGVFQRIVAAESGIDNALERRAIKDLTHRMAF